MRYLAFLLVLAGLLVAGDGPSLAPLPAAPQIDAKKAELGKMLFFDNRLSGDDTMSCATCHDPAQHWADGKAMSDGYPGALYFRNTPTVLNASLVKHAYWDGRLPMSDLQTLVRDHIAEAHFLQADGRLVLERLRQVPEYDQRFREVFGGEPSYGGVLKAVAEYLKTLRSDDAPYDRFLKGDQSAIPAEAQRGLELFKGKAGCVKCHHGPLLTDNAFHAHGVPENRAVFTEPKRHITFRRFFRTLGVTDYANLREDVGRYAVTKRQADRKRFKTPSLREVPQTAPYMHNGVFATLEDVLDFYRDVHKVSLTPAERGDLVAFLKTLSGKPVPRPDVKRPEYALRKLGEN